MHGTAIGPRRLWIGLPWRLASRFNFDRKLPTAGHLRVEMRLNGGRVWQTAAAGESTRRRVSAPGKPGAPRIPQGGHRTVAMTSTLADTDRPARSRGTPAFAGGEGT
jgi:hypothetical protein